MDRGAEWQQGRDGPVLEEVKFATILFADIVRSTELVAALSPDDAFQTLEPALSVLIQAVEEVGGTVNRVTGDGVMAMFGAPRADEDHALTACIAALTMIARTELLARAVSLRVGVHSGEFVVHPLQVSSARLLDAAGLAVHMAARIQQAAKPGEVWISAETRRLCGGRVQVDRNARVALRGIPGKLPLARLRGVDAAAGRLDATGRRALSPFIGRRTELRQLTAAWSGAQRGTGNAVLVTGEAGLGKSRFVAEFLRRRRGVPAATGRAIRWRREDGFHPLRGLAAQILGIAPGAPVAPALAGLPAPLRDAVGLLLGADTGPGWRGIAPSERSRRLRDSLAGLLRWWSADGPRIAVIDDLHWADSDTLDAVAAALRELPGMPVLLLLTARHDLPLDPAMRRLPLGPLTAAEAEELSRHVRPATGADGATAPLLARAGGNPFFIEEATASLEDLPPTLRVLIGSRIDRLPADAKRLVELLAALAEPVPLPLFAACAGRAPGEAELLRGLGALDRDGLLDVSEEGGLRRVACRHALVQEVAYRGLTERRRRELHAGIAGRLEAALGAEAPRH
ncbi:MAG: AAA family ATPase, partial [Acetobacteraceae bacterium]|nr:AAA family ATPase [Acetobacteraceae bacterium]